MALSTIKTASIANDAVTTDKIVNDGNLGSRNLIINGAQIVSQRNGTTDTTISSTGNVYTLDRWGAFVGQTGKISVQQSTDVPSGYSFKNSAKITSLSAYSIGTGDYFGYNTALEGQDVARLGFGASGAKSITISFWVKSSLTGTFGISVREQPSSPGRSFPTNYTISSANTWEYKTLTVPGDTSGTWSTDNTAGFNLWFDLGTGSTYQGTGDQWNSANDATTSGTVSVVGTNAATWYVTGVQVEVGNTATPFENRSFADEMIRCQRYYQEVASGSTYFAGNGLGTSNIIVGIPLATSMRATPSIKQNGYIFHRSGNVNSASANPSVSNFAYDIGRNAVGVRISGWASNNSDEVAYAVTPATEVLAFEAEL